MGRSKGMGWFVMVACLAAALSGCGENADSGGGPGAGAPPQRPASQSYTAGGDSGHSPLRNGGGADGDGVATDTGMLVLGGDQVTVQPLTITREVRASSPPVVTRADNPVCVQNTNVCAATEPIMQRQCSNSCHFCIQCPIPFVACVPWSCCDQSCQDVHAGDRCVAWTQACAKQENHWTETSLYSGLGALKTTEDQAPMKSAFELLTGLKLQFSYADATGAQKVVNCPLAAFKPTVGSDHFTFQLRDVPGCPPIFADQAGTPRMLGLVNALSEAFSYQEGSLVKTWDGRALEQPSTETYHPEIDLSVAISVQAAQ